MRVGYCSHRRSRHRQSSTLTATLENRGIEHDDSDRTDSDCNRNDSDCDRIDSDRNRDCDGKDA